MAHPSARCARYIRPSRWMLMTSPLTVHRLCHDGASDAGSILLPPPPLGTENCLWTAAMRSSDTTG